MTEAIIGKPFTSENAPRQGGKPGRITRKKLYRQMLDAVALKTTNERLAAALGGCSPKTVGEQVVAVLALQALNGDVAAIKEFMDGGYGKIIEKVESTTTVKQMGKIIAEPVGVQTNGKPSEGFEITFDIGSDPDNSTTEEEEDELDTD